MNPKEQKQRLQSLIKAQLSPLIDHDYVYWDLPYHQNIGDTLIWQGSLDFLAEQPHKMLDFGCSSTAYLGVLPSKTIILLHGGGNFGDIYTSSQDFRKKVLTQYPNNKIIILPQTIYFQDKNKEQNDFKIFSQHKNLYLCVRDQASYDTAIRYLSPKQVLLLPDMAFCIKEYTLTRAMPTGKKLLMQRIDVEAVKLNTLYTEITDAQSDWPTFEHMPIYSLYLKILLKLQRLLNNKTHYKKSRLAYHIDYYAMHYVRRKLLKTGIDFINEFDVVYTTRLHGCILSLLLDKKIILLDNSYGKNKAYYDAWLTGYDNIKIETC